MQEVHRSGPLKQKNKSHKQQFRSNRQLKNAAGGQVPNSVKGQSGGNHNESRLARRQRSANQRKTKREITLNRKRSIGQPDNAPIVVSVLYFSDTYNDYRAQSIINLLLQSEDDAIVHRSELGLCSFSDFNLLIF